MNRWSNHESSIQITYRVIVLILVVLLGFGSPFVLGTDNQASASSNAVATAVDVGSFHTCVVLQVDSLSCWGLGEYGRLGYGNTEWIGDNESPSKYGNVPVGGEVKKVTVGNAHTCVLIGTGAIRCFGRGSTGALGYGNTNNVGDDETPASVGDVPLGGTATAISAGAYHTCALMSTGSVRCWGEAGSGRLGYGVGPNQFGNYESIGDNETPASVGDVPLGGTATAISAGAEHTCALMSTGSVRCWGEATYGRLGYGNTNDVGDNETPASVGDVLLGGTARAVSAGGHVTCALMLTGSVRCWGRQYLGYGGNRTLVGDNETPASVGDVPLGGTSTAISVGHETICARLTTNNIRCWGDGGSLQLGYGNANNIGDDETPSSVGDVPVGVDVLEVSTADSHTCAVLSLARVRCWGSGLYGKLGYSSSGNRGFNEFPSSLPDVDFGLKPTALTTSPTSNTPTSPTSPKSMKRETVVKANINLSERALLRLSGLVKLPGSKVKMVLDVASRRVCSLKSGGIYPRTVGLCRAKLTVVTRDKKSSSNWISLRVTKTGK